MMQVLGLFLTLILSQATSIPSPNGAICQLGEWSDWSRCQRSSKCPNEGDQELMISYPLPVASSDYDSGRAHMGILKELKEKDWQQALDCRAQGACPLMPSLSGLPHPCVDGDAAGYPCLNIDLLSTINLEDLGSINIDYERGNDIWGWVDPETGDEYAVVGMWSGTSFVRITDPVNPEVLAFLPARTTGSTWRDVKVFANHAYIVSEANRHGLQVYDLTQLRHLVPTTGKVPRVEAVVNYDRFGNAHNIAINEDTGFAYVVGQLRDGQNHTCISPGGLHIIDIKEPANPIFAGCFNEDGYTHDTQCVVYHGPDAEYYDHEICINSNEDTLTIVDVSEKSNPHMISRTGYLGQQYTHQAWFTEDHVFILLDDELDELRSGDKSTRTFLWDLTSLSEPVLREVYYSNQPAIDHNQYIKGNLSYQANYEAGLRVLHIDQVNYKLQEVAYFDVFPSDTTDAFNGAWSNYPYLPSGNVIVSSINDGLFVLRPHEDAMRQLVGTNYGLQTRTRTVETLPSQPCYEPSTQTRVCDPGPC